MVHSASIIIFHSAAAGAACGNWMGMDGMGTVVTQPDHDPSRSSEFDIRRPILIIQSAASVRSNLRLADVRSLASVCAQITTVVQAPTHDDTFRLAYRTARHRDIRSYLDSTVSCWHHARHLMDGSSKRQCSRLS